MTHIFQTSQRIRSFKHRGLRALYEGRTAKRVAPEHVQKLRDILAQLDRSEEPGDMDLPGYRLHRLHGSLKDHYAVSVSGNWRVTCAFDRDKAVIDVDYLDYR